MRYNWDSSGQHFCTNPYSTGRRRRASSWNRNQWKRYYLWLNYSFLIENPPKHEQQYGNNVRFGRWVVVDPRPDLSPARRTNQRGGIGSNGWSWKKDFILKCTAYDWELQPKSFDIIDDILLKLLRATCQTRNRPTDWNVVKSTLTKRFPPFRTIIIIIVLEALNVVLLNRLNLLIYMATMQSIVNSGLYFF